MVSFICDACGQTVKKQKVEKHYQNECRNCSVLSCIDCGKDFPGDSYVCHTSCISEAEKYQGKLYKAKDKSNKGERKQQEWLEQVRTLSSETGKQDPRVRKLLAKITSYDNVPRKEAKFKKFCENSINVKDSVLLEKLWQVFSGVKNSNSSSRHNDCCQNTNCDTENTETFSSSLGVEDSSLGNSEEETNNNNNQQILARDCEEDDKDSNLKGKKKKKRKHEEVEENKVEFDDECKTKKMKKCRRKGQENATDVKTNNVVETNNLNSCKTEENAHENGLENGGRKKKKKQKKDKKLPENPSTDCPTIPEENHEKVEPKEKFNWESVIKKLLKSAPDQEMSIKKLRKKVLNEFQAQGGDSKPRTEQELRVLFEKKLHKNQKVKVWKERAKLCK